MNIFYQTNDYKNVKGEGKKQEDFFKKFNDLSFTTHL